MLNLRNCFSKTAIRNSKFTKIFRIMLDIHPRLPRWIVCIPTSPQIISFVYKQFNEAGHIGLAGRICPSGKFFMRVRCRLGVASHLLAQTFSG